jgi:hypothetical protein
MAKMRRAKRLTAAAWKWTRHRIAWKDVVIVALVGASVLFTAHYVNENNHKWCAALITLDDADQAALKAPPSQRPKGAYSLALIRDFHDLRQGLGCGATATGRARAAASGTGRHITRQAAREEPRRKPA